MTTLQLITRGALALLFTAAGAGAGEQNQRTFQFADPAAPGKVIIQIGLGDVQVVGAEVTEVTVQSEEPLGGSDEPREDGLRRLDSGPGSRVVSSSGNTITIGAGVPFGAHGAAGASDMTITVPAATTVVVERSGPGDIHVEKLSGDIEVRAIAGDVVLQDLSGGVAVETVNGDVRAVFTALAAERPVSISAVRGDVDLYVPASAKADVRFRTLRGEILTDFGAELDTRMEDQWTDESPEAAAEVDRRNVERERRAAEKMARQAEEAARQAEVEARNAAKHGGVHVSIPPIPPIPPMPHIPPMAGGRVVAGALNAGGTDISVTTLNGSIRFRKAN
jgi:hypothetical protein